MTRSQLKIFKLLVLHKLKIIIRTQLEMLKFIRLLKVIKPKKIKLSLNKTF